MTKTEIRSAINKAVYQYAESLGYQVSDDMISRVYFIDQALRIPEEHLEPIADIINDYLNIHYPPKDEEEQM